MKRRNTVTALVILAFLTFGLVKLGAALWQGGALRTQLGLVRQDPSQIMSFFGGGAEAAANEDLDREHWFIQLFGGFQRLTGRRVVEDVSGENHVAKLDNGTLNFVSLDAQQKDVTENGEKTVAFQQALSEMGIDHLFVLNPQKIGRQDGVLPVGVHNYANQEADAFLTILDRAGSDYLDLRPYFEGNGNYADWFFRTDHHWRPEAAFYAWSILNEELTQRYGLAMRGELADPELWETQVLEDFFLGSQGKRVGTLYAGLDDFTIYTPNFDTNLTYSCQAYGFERTGSFNQSVCFPERVAERDLFGGNPYTYYSGGDYPLATMTNHNYEEGPRILIIRESYACTLAPFLALSSGEVITVDLRYFEGDLLETIQSLQPDLVITLYTAGTVALDNMFAFQGEG